MAIRTYETLIFYEEEIDIGRRFSKYIFTKLNATN